jgi:hypothetical protein
MTTASVSRGPSGARSSSSSRRSCTRPPTSTAAGGESALAHHRQCLGPRDTRSADDGRPVHRLPDLRVERHATQDCLAHVAGRSPDRPATRRRRRPARSAFHSGSRARAPRATTRYRGHKPRRGS